MTFQCAILSMRLQMSPLPSHADPFYSEAQPLKPCAIDDIAPVKHKHRSLHHRRHASPIQARPRLGLVPLGTQAGDALRWILDRDLEQRRLKWRRRVEELTRGDCRCSV